MGIHLWHGLQQGDVLNSFTRIVEEWNASSADKVELRSFTDYKAPVEEAFKQDPENQPSLVLAPEFMTGAMGKRSIIPISHLLNTEQLEKIAKIVRLTFGSEDKLSCLPFNPACGILYMNRDMLNKIGKEPGFVPKTLRELDAVCEELIAQKVAAKGFTCAWPAAYLVEIPAAQQNIALADPENGKKGYGQFQLSKPWLIRHFLDLREMQRRGIFHYAGRDNNSKNPFLNREVAFFLQGSAHHSTLQKEAEFEVDFAPVPTLAREADPDKKYAFPLGGAALWALDNPNTERMKNGVVAFLNYLAGDEVQERWHKETAYVPVSSTLPAKLEEFYKDHPLHKAVVEQTINALVGENSFGVHMPNYGSIARPALFELIEKILSDETNDSDIPLLLEEFDRKYSLEH